MNDDITLKCHSCQITTLVEIAENSDIASDEIEFIYCPVCGSEIYEDEEFRMWIDDD